MIYDRKALLSLKLRSNLQLRKVSRPEFLTRLQIIRTLDPIVDEAYKDVERDKWEKQIGDNPHGHPWHVSFHGSQFPGNDPMACPRQALYRMMDFPPPEPTSRWLRQLASAGKGIEVDLVRTWHEAGILLSAGPDEEIQTGFEVPEAWLTSSVDAVILPPRWNKPLPVEIKTKFQRVIDKMKVGAQGPDDAHIKQIKVQLALVALNQQEMWPGLDPLTHGYIYYMSRDNPRDTAEFRVDLDMDFYNMGIQRLKEWKALFQEGHLPVKNPSKKHPFGWRWSYPPCQFCSYKKTCQLDFQSGNQDLDESVGIARAKLIRPEYDAEAAKQRVKDRWTLKENDE